MPYKTYEAEIKMLVALTESGRRWEYRRTQSIKWTAEGAVKGRVIDCIHKFQYDEIF